LKLVVVVFGAWCVGLLAVGKGFLYTFLKTFVVGHLLPPIGGKEEKAIGLANALSELVLPVRMTSFVDIVLWIALLAF
jgi:hypothetical protein